MTEDQDRVGWLLANRRWCYFIPLDGFIEGRGWRVSVVIEGETGHYPTGDLDHEMRDHREPWFWGMTYHDAEQTAAETNAIRLALSEADIVEILRSAKLIPRRAS